jgi:hypothetical protein
VSERAGVCPLLMMRSVGTGKGSFGTVKLVVHNKTGVAYALKSVWKRQIVDTGQHSHVMSEKKVMQCLRHPFLTRL